MLFGFIITISYFMIFFIVAQIIKNNSIVDIGWGLGFVVSGTSLLIYTGNYSLDSILVMALVSLWGLRLFYHILRRNIGEEEDFRYKAWRKAWGKWVIPRAFIQVFMLQGLFQFMIASTFLYFIENQLELTLLSYIGVVLFLVGYAFQVIGDAQLKSHIKKKTGTLLTTGTWSITRHPNYFGESLMWVSLYVVVLFSGGPWWLIISPLTISTVLRFISIPLLEEKMSKRDGWDEYAKKTPIFYPFGLKK